jgi:hypothetical protein
MRIPTPVSRAAVRATAAAAWLALAGCASLGGDPAEPVVAPPAAAAPQAVVEPEPAAVPAPAAAPTPAPRTRVTAPRNIVVLFQQGTGDYAAVAARIAEQLPVASYRVSLVPIRSPVSPELLAPLVALRPSIAVAIGREAAELARKHLAATPLVFCQVSNHEEFLSAGQSVWGVGSMPPGTAADVARGVHSVLDRVAAGTTKGLPPLTPLTARL